MGRTTVAIHPEGEAHPSAKNRWVVVSKAVLGSSQAKAAADDAKISNMRKSYMSQKRKRLSKRSSVSTIEIAMLEGAAKTREDRLLMAAVPKQVKLKDLLNGRMNNLRDLLTAQKVQRSSSSGTHHPWYLLHPFGTFMSRWDGATSLALIFTAIVTPFEVGFLPAPTDADTLFIINRVIDLTFILDMGLQFVLMYRNAGGEDADDEGGETAWEMSLRRIVVRYLRGWFVIDVLSILPSAFDVIPVVNGDGQTKEEGSAGSSPLRIMRVVRAARLVKLVRLMRASRVMKRLEIRISLPYSTITIFTLTAQIMLTSHYAACILGMLGSVFVSTPLASWQATHGYCTPLSQNATVHVDLLEFRCVDKWDLYLQSFFWGTGMIVGFASTPLYGPYPSYLYVDGPGTIFTISEQILVLVLNLLGAFQWAYVTGKVVDIICNLNPDRTAFRNGLDQLNDYCRFHGLSSNISIELREYYYSKREWYRAQARSHVAEGFAPSLAEKVIWESFREVLTKAPCFKVLLVPPRTVELLEQELEREAIHSLVKKRKSVTGPSRDPYAELAETSQQVAALDEQRQRRRMNMQQREKQHAETREEAKGFLVQVALSMRNEVYAPGDRLPPRRLYIITRGTAIYRGRVLSKGDSFGEQDVMLTGNSFSFGDMEGGQMVYVERMRPQAYAITFLQVQFIGTEEFEMIQPNYPKAYAAVKRVAVYRAVHEWLRAYLVHEKQKVRLAAAGGAHTITSGNALCVMKAKRKFLALLGRAKAAERAYRDETLLVQAAGMIEKLMEAAKHQATNTSSVDRVRP